MGETASGVRLDAGKVMEAVRSPGDRRRVAGVELLRRLMKVNDAGMAEDGNRKGRRSRRGASSPGTRGERRRWRRRSETAVNVAGVWRPARRIGDLALDRVAPSSIPLEGMTRTTMRICGWLQFAEGRPREAVPWWGGGGTVGLFPLVSFTEKRERGEGGGARMGKGERLGFPRGLPRWILKGGAGGGAGVVHEAMAMGTARKSHASLVWRMTT
jgi:hypothetical protein